VTATAQDRETPPAGDPLFGTGLRPGAGFDQHDWVQLRTSFWTVLRELPRLVGLTARLGWRADRAGLVTVVLAEVLVGAGTAFGLLAANQVLVRLLAGGPTPERVTDAVPALLLVLAAAALSSVARYLAHTAGGRLGPRVDRLAYAELLERAARVELATIEESGFHNLMGSARRGAMSARQLTIGVVALLNALIGLLAVAGVLGVLHPVLLVLLVAAVLPRGWGAVRSARARFASIRGWMEVSRRLDLLAGLLVDRGTAEEIRAHDVGPFLLGHHRRLAITAEAEQARLARAEARVALLAAALAGLATAGAYSLLGGLLMAGVVPLAAAGTAVLAITTGTGKLGALVDGVNQLYEHGLFVLDWQRACVECDRHAMRTGTEPVSPRPALITARAARFSYPGASRPALDGVDLTLRGGEVVALVGENGSGKTTLARILTGLYLPTEGAVCWDGVRIERLRRADVFDRVALVSQEFVQWPFTARVNVVIGRASAGPDAGRLAAASAACGADELVACLPAGWDSLLAREFWGGTSLSGGQWQRIALARAWFRDAPIVVFDEPTSALDARAEAAAFDRVADLAGRGRAVLLISHRLASVRRADRIHVLSRGKVIEHGSHDELMAHGGEYATTYRLQAARYA